MVLPHKFAQPLSTSSEAPYHEEMAVSPGKTRLTTGKNTAELNLKCTTDCGPSCDAEQASGSADARLAESAG